jgi:hypothetical protein
VSAPELRNYRVSLAGDGELAVRVTAESRRAACDLVERMWSENNLPLTVPNGCIWPIEILDAYEEGGEP